MSSISVVMPIYRAEKYLHKTLDSIMTQTFRDFEVTCIDDVSPDDSATIVMEYMRRDKRFSLLRNEKNCGAAISRNRGLEQANGKYVIFLDADDVFERDLLEQLYTAAERYQADVTFAEHDVLKEGRDCYEVDENFIVPYQNSPFSLDDLPNTAFSLWVDVPWNKLCRKEFLVENHIEFQNLTSNNDTYFHVAVMMSAKTMIHVGTQKRLIHYRMNTDTQISAHRNPENAFLAMEAVRNRMITNGEADLYFEKFMVFAMGGLTAAIKTGIEKKKKPYYEFLQKEGLGRLGLLEYINTEHDRSVLPKGTQQILELFLKQPYESGWFEKSPGFRQKLYNANERVAKFIAHAKSHSWKLALWGAGEIGETFLEYLPDKGDIVCVIDNSLQKQGMSLMGKPIVSLAQAVDCTDMVLVMNRLYFPDIYKQVKSSGAKMKIFQFYGYLDYEAEIKDCIVNARERQIDG